MKTEVARVGDSLSIRIPVAYAEALDLQAGQTVEIENVFGNLVVRAQPPSLDELLRDATPENLHGEADWGGMGRETWYGIRGGSRRAT